MRFLRAMLPHITIALNISVLILLYLDSRNPMMGFLTGVPFVVLMLLTASSAIANAITVYLDWRSGDNKKPADKNKKISNDT